MCFLRYFIGDTPRLISFSFLYCVSYIYYTSSNILLIASRGTLLRLVPLMNFYTF